MSCPLQIFSISTVSMLLKSCKHSCNAIYCNTYIAVLYHQFVHICFVFCNFLLWYLWLNNIILQISIITLQHCSLLLPKPKLISIINWCNILLCSKALHLYLSNTSRAKGIYFVCGAKQFIHLKQYITQSYTALQYCINYFRLYSKATYQLLPHGWLTLILKSLASVSSIIPRATYSCLQNKNIGKSSPQKGVFWTICHRKHGGESHTT
jgi:hypothetical protein